MNLQRILIGTLALGLLLALAVGLSQAQESEPQDIPSSLAEVGTGFTYQGQLKSAGEPVSGDCEMAFRLYDAAAPGGSQVGSPITRTVTISAGLFTEQLDFGAGVFDGDARWLDIRVQCPGDGDYTDLGRQALTAAPYALYSLETAAHDHLGETWSGSEPLTITGFFGGPDYASLVLRNAHSSGDGLVVESAGSHGVSVESAGIDGVFVNSADGAGVFVGSVDGDGVAVNSAGQDGVFVGSADDAGLHMNSAGTHGVYVESANGGAGFRVDSASVNGVFVDEAGEDGFDVNTADNDGLDVNSAGRHGVYVHSAGNNGLHVHSAYTDAVHVESAGEDGVHVESADGDGVEVESATGRGVFVGPETDGYAGYFMGTLYANHISKGGGSFKIDHPLDPQNKYLYHSFVESPDMMNVYNGNVILDEGGEAWVELPEWFEALNHDFRYQLTPIGAPGPNLYVAEKIRDNRFQIAGGDSGMEVSWQVTGVRQDPYAEANRIVVEEKKPPEERGTYLHPEAWGVSETMGLSRPKAQTDEGREHR